MVIFSHKYLDSDIMNMKTFALADLIQRNITTDIKVNTINKSSLNNAFNTVNR